MPISRSTLDTINQTFEVSLSRIYESEAANLWRVFAMTVETGSKQNNVSYLTALPAIRRWTGSRVFQPSRVINKSFTLEKYDALEIFEEADVMFDNANFIGPRIDEIVAQSARVREKLATDELVTNNTGPDGVALFATTHPYGSGGATQSNKTTSDLSYTTLDTAAVAMQSYTDEYGESLNITPTTLMVGPKLQATAFDVTGSTKLKWSDNTGVTGQEGSTSTNIVGLGTLQSNVYGGGRFDVIVNPRLVGTYDDYWFLFDASKTVKPIVLFEGQGPTPVMPDPGVQFNSAALTYGVEGYWAPAPAAWMTAYAGIL